MLKEDKSLCVWWAHNVREEWYYKRIMGSETAPIYLICCLCFSWTNIKFNRSLRAIPHLSIGCLIFKGITRPKKRLYPQYKKPFDVVSLSSSNHISFSQYALSYMDNMFYCREIFRLIQINASKMDNFHFPYCMLMIVQLYIR